MESIAAIASHCCTPSGTLSEVLRLYHTYTNPTSYCVLMIIEDVSEDSQGSVFIDPAFTIARHTSSQPFCTIFYTEWQFIYVYDRQQKRERNKKNNFGWSFSEVENDSSRIVFCDESPLVLSTDCQ
ncbi:hypothetical protein TNCV_89601 [Trichonephila clavipes]|nr:hypothetical protein TNCV_89601 [Trichonephila clavipes]